MDREGQGQTRRFASDLLFSQPRRSFVPDGDIRERMFRSIYRNCNGGPNEATARPENGLAGGEAEMKRAIRKKPPTEDSLGDKLLRSAQQARDWVQGKPVRVRVSYVPAPRVDLRKLRTRMGLSQTQFAAKFGFSVDSIQNWEQGHRQPEGPARILLVVIAKNPKAVEEALRSR
jgi:putative transcriptional regulator